jgi:PAS domain S-box-containing protein
VNSSIGAGWIIRALHFTKHEIGAGKVAIHPDDVNGLVDYWRSILGSGEPGEIEVRLRRFDGEYRWFLFRSSALCDESGKVVKWHGTNVDIEERRRAEEVVRARERELELIVETIPALVWCADLGGELTYVNRRILDYIGTTLDSLAQRGWINFLHPDGVEPTLRAWCYAVASGEPHEVQYRLRRFDGAYRWFHVLGELVRDSEGHTTRWYGLLIDIDDRRSMEEALRSGPAPGDDYSRHEYDHPAAGWGSAKAGITAERRVCELRVLP